MLTQCWVNVTPVSGMCCCCHSVFRGAAGGDLRYFPLSVANGNTRTLYCMRRHWRLYYASYSGQLMSVVVCYSRGEQCCASDSRHTQHKSGLREYLWRVLLHVWTSSRGHASKTWRSSTHTLKYNMYSYSNTIKGIIKGREEKCEWLQGGI